MKLNSQMANELGLTYWKMKNSEPQSIEASSPKLAEEEQNLLKNILKSIQIHFDSRQLGEHNSALTYALKDLLLIFDDVNLADSKEVMHLAPLSAMITQAELKKKTWFKLKKRFL